MNSLHLSQLQPTNQMLRKQTLEYGYMYISHNYREFTYVFSPDTDVYHIGLPLDTGEKEILIEISVAGSTHKRILSLSNLKHNLINDPDLSSISPTQLLQVFQTLYVVTGCDYTSFFCGFGKTTLMKCFCQFI